MVCPPASQDAAFDVQAAIATFLADASASSLELPQMAPSERKTAKKVADAHPDIVCESFGFGVDRRLHLLKRKPPVSADPATRAEPAADAAKLQEYSSVKIKNTFIDDWDAGAAKSEAQTLYRSMPSQMPKSRDEDGSEVEGPSTSQRSERHLAPAEGDAVAPSTPAEEAPQDSSPSQLSTECSPDAVGAPGPQGSMQVRHTFIHFQGAPADARVVQSMPHGMFGKCLLEEAAAKAKDSSVQPEPAPVAEEAPAKARREGARHELSPVAEVWEPAAAQAPITPPPEVVAPGTMVIIEGLSKSPAFNGCVAYVQYFDTGAGRYSVMMTLPGYGQVWAKVKGENIRLVPPFHENVAGGGIHHQMNEAVTPGIASAPFPHFTPHV